MARGGRKNYSIPIVNPVSFKEKHFSIHPYLMGVLLGDGGLRTSVMVSSSDDEIINKIKNILPKKHSIKHVDKYDYRIIGESNTNLILNKIKDYDLFGKYSDEKFVDESLSKLNESIKSISGAPWGSALACVISYGYISMLGAKGLRSSTEFAILNANYIKARLNGSFEVLYTGEQGRAAHEMIIDCRPFKDHGIEVTDIAKRLMDYGFHAPTVSFPVAGTMMIEPTESEDLPELDRFCDAMIAIRKEIDAAHIDTPNNPLKNAPHTQAMLTADQWDFPYSRQQAAFPLPYVSNNKFWPTVRRVDDAYGDRNLICTCTPIEAYAEA